MSRKYIIVKVKNGIATVKHKCWFCQRKHKLQYPFDDVGMQSKTDKLCIVCEEGLEKFKRNNPEMC